MEPEKVQGSINSGGADSGHPIKTGGKYNMTASVFSDGQRGDTQIDINGNQKVGLYDIFGFQGQFTPMRDLKTVEPFRLVGATFPTSNDAQYWTLSNSGANSGAATNIVVTLTSGTANSGYGQITSVKSGRFIFANPNQFRGIVRVTTITAANNTRRWGAFTVSSQVPQNGFYFELSGTGVLSVNYAIGGTATSVVSGSFNGNVSTFTIDTNAHQYEIIYYIAGIYFYIDNVLVHTIIPTTTSLSNTFTLPCTATSINSASGTVSGVLEIWAFTIIRLGRDISEAQGVHITSNTTTVCKIGAGTLHSIVANNPTNATITIYDNTVASGTVLGIINPGASATPFALDYHLPFFTGLTIVTAGSPDLTIVYE